MDSCQLLSSSASDPVLCSLPITSSEPYSQFGRISTWKPRLRESESVCGSVCVCMGKFVCLCVLGVEDNFGKVQE